MLLGAKSANHRWRPRTRPPHEPVDDSPTPSGSVGKCRGSWRRQLPGRKPDAGLAIGGLFGALPAYLVLFRTPTERPNSTAPSTSSLPPSSTTVSPNTSSTTAEPSSTNAGDIASNSDCLTPKVTLQPDTGRVGTRITVSGCGFPSRAVLTSFIGQVFTYPDLPAVRTDSRGRFRVSAVLKPSSYGIDNSKPLSIGYQVDSDHSIEAHESFLLQD